LGAETLPMVKFGTSGIRGRFGTEITASLAIQLGACLAEKGRIVVGRDTRTSGELLENALVSGITAASGDVVRIGIAPTPTLALAAKKFSATGVMITASHNPPDYNGFKLFNSSGEEIGSEEERKIEEKLAKGVKIEVKWDAVGREIRDKSAIYEHIGLALSLVDVAAIRKKAPKVVVDCGNGAASVIMPYALRQAGCKVVAVNAEPSGFFARGLEPNEENLRQTSEMVKAVGADLGIAHDGDADRAIIIDENGKLLGLDAQLAMMCGEILHAKKGVVVSTIEASLCVKEAVEKAGGKLAITKVGSLWCAREMKKQKAVFAGEPCGEYIFSGGVPVPDGILSGLKFVELFCKKGKLGSLREKIKAYPMRRAKYAAREKDAAMKRIAPELKKAFKGKVSDEDGIRADFEGGWLLVRASGTEPVIRITAEAKSEEKLKEIFGKAEGIVRRLI
jgi:phosphoglucosamine mutase